MHWSRFAMSRCVGVALVVLAGSLAVRAEDDFVTDDEPTPPPVQQPAVGGQLPGGGRVIVMPGLQLQLGGPGQMQIQAGVGAPQPAAAVEGESRPEPYLGVVAGPVMPQVRAQLDLPEGVGLSIDSVAAGGPAEKAGVKRFDVIHKFNDQVVCSPDQLTTLVRVVGVGTKVSLAILRGGHERLLEAVIEEQTAPIAAGVPPGFAAGWVPPALPVPLPVLPGNLRAQIMAIGPNVHRATIVSDARGTVEIRSAGAGKTVTVKDPAGVEVHSGPLDTDDDLEQVPEGYRGWVREIDGGQPAAQRIAPEAEGPTSEAESAETPGPKL